MSLRGRFRLVGPIVSLVVQRKKEKRRDGRNKVGTYIFLGGLKNKGFPVCFKSAGLFFPIRKRNGITSVIKKSRFLLREATLWDM